MTAKKLQDILLKDKYKQAKKNSNKALNTIVFAYCNSNYQGQKTNGCWQFHKPGYKENSC